METGNHVKNSGLPGTIGTNEAEEVIRFEREVEPGNGSQPAEFDAAGFQFEERHGLNQFHRSTSFCCRFPFSDAGTDEQSLGAGNHNNNQKKRVDDHPVLRDGAEQFGQKGEEYGGKDDTKDTSHAADYHHNDNLERFQECELGRIDIGDEMGVEGAGGAGEEGAGDEGNNFDLGGINADSFGGDFIITDGQKCFTIGGIDEIINQEYHGRGNGENPEESGEFGDAAIAAGSAEEIDILHDNADDFAEPESGDGKVVPFQAEAGDADEKSEDGGHGASGKKRQGENRGIGKGTTGDMKLISDDGGSVGADGHEAGVAERKLPGESIDEIQARGENDIDAYIYDDLKVVRIEFVLKQGDDETEENRGEEK